MPSRPGPAASLPTPTSLRLLARARRGDASALGELLSRYLPALRRWTHGRLPGWARSAAETSDFVQDAVLRTVARLDAFQPQGRRALATYLRAAVSNRIADEHRRAARWSLAELPEDLRAPNPSPLDAAIHEQARRRYRAALGSLSRTDRELIVAHVELDYTHAQLGCMTGRSSNAARMALSRALGRLAERMREE